jgi:hypothetical protein
LFRRKTRLRHKRMRAPSGRSAKKELAEGGPPADLLTTIQAARLKI